MEQSLQEYYDNLFDMFGTKGWKQFQEDAKLELDNGTKYSDLVCDTNDKWQYHRGQISKLRALVGFETFIKQAYEDAINPEVEDFDTL